MLTLPIEVDGELLAIQLRPLPDGSFGLEHIGLARYATSLAAVALRHARTRRGEVSSKPGASEVRITLSHDLRQPLNVMLGCATTDVELHLARGSGDAALQERWIRYRRRRFAARLRAVPYRDPWPYRLRPRSLHREEIL